MNNEFHTVRGYELLRQSKSMLTAAMEDYLEMIYRASQKQGYLRINQLALLLNVKASSATKMVQKLGEFGLIIYKKYGIIVLTKYGKEVGNYLLSRHNIIENFLNMIKIKGDILEETELIEHYVSPNTLHKIDLLNNFFAVNAGVSQKFMQFIEEHTEK